VAFKFEEKSGSAYPSQTPAGLWKLHVNSEEYRAWAFWLGAEFGRRFFAEPVMVVWFRWPPTTDGGADEIAKLISEARDAINDEKGNRRRCLPVNQHPAPWNGHIPAPPAREQIISVDAMQEIRGRLDSHWVRNGQFVR
jgi:hypothetical protein